MQEITPDLIASIATRLLQGTSGTSVMPQHDSGLQKLATHGADRPLQLPAPMDPLSRPSGAAGHEFGSSFPHSDDHFPHVSSGAFPSPSSHAPSMSSSSPNHLPGYLGQSASVDRPGHFPGAVGSESAQNLGAHAQGVPPNSSPGSGFNNYGFHGAGPNNSGLNNAEFPVPAAHQYGYPAPSAHPTPGAVNHPVPSGHPNYSAAPMTHSGNPVPGYQNPSPLSYSPGTLSGCTIQSPGVFNQNPVAAQQNHVPVGTGNPIAGSPGYSGSIPSHSGFPQVLPGIMNASFGPLAALSGGNPHATALPSGDIATPSPIVPAYSTQTRSNSQSQGGPLTDGVRDFAQRIRTSNYGGDRQRCALHPEQDILQRMFKGKFDRTGLGGARPMDIASIRNDFPILRQQVHGKPLAWFDNAATTQKPQSVIDAISHYYENNNSNIHRGAHTLAARSTDAFEQARQKVQSFLGAASSKEIIFVRGTTEGINLVAQTFGKKFLQPGDEIILSTLEHHANIVPWQMVAKERGAVIRVIPVTDHGEIMLEAYQALLNPRTRLVSLAHASNSLGTILPVAEMTQMAKRYGARVLIDGAQSVSHLPVNMQQIGCDFFVFSGHKIFGPTGIGVVYAREELQEMMPPWQGGGNMIKHVTFEETTFSDPPAKFEAGTPNVADTVGLGAALDYVNRLGLQNIAEYEHELLVYGTSQLSRINGLRIIGTAREKVGVLSFVLHNKDTIEVGKMLDQEGIAVRAGHHCSQPSLRRFGLDATVRPSLAFYNTMEEIDRLAEAIRRIQRM